MFIILTSGFTQIGIKFLGTKSGAAHNRLTYFFVRSVAPLDPACTNLSALGENAAVEMAVSGLVGNRHNVNATLMPSILS